MQHSFTRFMLLAILNGIKPMKFEPARQFLLSACGSNQKIVITCTARELLSFRVTENSFLGRRGDLVMTIF